MKLRRRNTREKEEKEDKKRGRHNHNEREIEGNRDRLSDMPDCVLIRILSFLKAEEAVRTCILSSTWQRQHLWKHLPALTLKSSDFGTVEGFMNFVNGILPLRDFSTALDALDFEHRNVVEPHVLESMKVFGTHLSSIKQVSIDVYDDTVSNTLLNWLTEMTNIESLIVTPRALQALSLFPDDIFKLKLTSWCNLKSLKLNLTFGPCPLYMKNMPGLTKLELASGKSWKEDAKLRETVKAKLKRRHLPILVDGMIEFLLQNSPSAKVDIL